LQPNFFKKTHLLLDRFFRQKVKNSFYLNYRFIIVLQALPEVRASTSSAQNGKLKVVLFCVIAGTAF